jgi:ABC-2 type transport system permease protein
VSATTHAGGTPGATTAGTIDLGDSTAVPMGRLAAVELRKALDTRAGRWFIISILVLVLAVQVIYAFAAPDDALGYGDFLGVAGAVLGYFMPILVIMLVTSEASQRNGLVTFTLEPRRSRVVVAKFLAGFALSFAVMVLAALIAVVGTLVGVATGAEADWSVDGNLLFNGFVLANVIGVLIGFAIATLLMNTPAAIVAYFVYSLILPIAVGILGSLSPGFADVAPWIEFNTAQAPLFQGDFTPTAQEWAQIATSGTIWLVVPLALGIARLLRIEFK